MKHGLPLVLQADACSKTDGNVWTQATLLRRLFWPQVTHVYSVALDRSDHALLQHGFVLEGEEPLLAAVDHVAGREHTDDSLYGEDIFKPYSLSGLLRKNGLCHFDNINGLPAIF